MNKPGFFSKGLTFSLLIICLLLVVPRAGAEGNRPLPEEVKRVVFLGNSITFSGQFIADIEAFYRASHPERSIEWINVGLPSETVSGLSEEGHAEGKFPRPDLHERLERVLEQTKPDLVLACYGMNDGIYMPFDEERFRLYKNGLERLHQQVESSGAAIIHLTPPVYDELRGGVAGYDAVLDKYAEWILEQQAVRDWEVIDIHGPMRDCLEAERSKNRAFYLASDGVHPGDEGHWLMAKAVLSFFEGKGVEKAGSIFEAINGFPEKEQLVRLVREKQILMRDAWLTATGHTRPGLKKGLPLDEAMEQAALMEERLRILTRR